MITANLLDDDIRVITPYIKVQIGSEIIGGFQQSEGIIQNESGVFIYKGTTYPNYIQTLQVEKINGQVNTYTLNLVYPITYGDDPNKFEKLFSSVSNTRFISFTYGDMSAPEAFIYKNEEAMITDVKSNFQISESTITYVITAVSSSIILTAGAFNFPYYKHSKPSDIIKYLLRHNEKYHIQDIFTGMKNYDLVISNNLIASDDIAVEIKAQKNMDILEYVSYLVNCMQSSTDPDSGNIYVFKVIDDINNEYGGTYFKIYSSDSSANSLDTYELDIGYTDINSNNAITNFSLDDNLQYSIFFQYYGSIYSNEYVQRINESGEIEDIYSPLISSNTSDNLTSIEDQNWWNNVTQYPLSATITLRGLLRPAILMSKLELNIIFYGQKHIASGSYIITKEVDNIGLNGSYTTLSAIRIS